MRCLYCESKRGDLLCLGCQCLAHKGCAYGDTVSRLQNATEVCPRCQLTIENPPQLIPAIHSWGRPWPFLLKRNSFQPYIFFNKNETRDQLDDNETWTRHCLDLAEKAPSWAKPTLLRASKKNVRHYQRY